MGGRRGQRQERPEGVRYGEWYKLLLPQRDEVWNYTVRHKKLHPSYWYINFAQLCHTVIIFGIYMHMRISHCLPVWQSL